MLKMKLTNCMLLLLLLLATSSCSANSQQSEPSREPGAAGENAEKSGNANAVDKSQNKRGAPSVPVVVGTGPAAQHTAYINHHVVAAPVSAHTTHAAIGSVPFAYGHAAISTGGHFLQTPAAGVPQPVLQKVSYVGPVTATTTTTTLKLATVSEGTLHHQHHQTPALGGSPILGKYNYQAVPQVTYAHYPQYQLVHHQAGSGAVQPATIYTAHALHEHPVAEIGTHHHQPQPQQQQQTAYAHQQPIYAHHPAAIHYALPTATLHNYAGQHHQQQQQQALSHTQALHYQQQAAVAASQPAVPIVHQAPIAAINQVHQAQQVYATQGQLTKYPLAASGLYGTGGSGLQQNQIYSTVPSYAYHQHSAGVNNGLVGKQLLPTVAAPVHLKSLVPLTTATTTQHHGNGISYSAFTQPSHPQLKSVPQSVLQTQPTYYNTAASNVQQQQQQQQQQYQQQAHLFYRNQLQQQSAQQQQRVPAVYSTVASPLQKAPIVYGSGQFSHPVPSQYAAYSYGSHQQPQPQQQQQQSTIYQQPQASLGRLTYAASSSAGGTGAFGGRGSIYLLH